MKTILAMTLTIAFVAAEVPSNSYLPPPPNRGYPKSSPPTIIAARTLDQGHHQGDHHNGDHQHDFNGNNDFARSSINHDQNGDPHSHSAHVHGDHPESAHNQVGHEHAGRDHAQVRYNSNEEHYDHSAGYSRSAFDDVNTTASYDAEERGFSPQTSYDDTEVISRPGYDGNANNFQNNNGYHGNEQNGVHGTRSNGYN